jgi:hypothetical protein
MNNNIVQIAEPSEYSDNEANVLLKRFVFSSGIILIITGLTKIINASGHVGILNLDDSLFRVTFRREMLLAGITELIVALLCMSIKNKRICVPILARIQAHNESESQPHFNLSLARVYLNGADPELATRTWQGVMQDIVAKEKDGTRYRWETAIRDKNFDRIRNLAVCPPEHFDRAFADGKVSTNVYLRQIHNHALGMEWLLKSAVPRLQWPKLVFKVKRAITVEEHVAIIQREQNVERRNFYELLWPTGATQLDGAWLSGFRQVSLLYAAVTSHC